MWRVVECNFELLKKKMGGPDDCGLWERIDLESDLIREKDSTMSLAKNEVLLQKSVLGEQKWWGGCKGHQLRCQKLRETSKREPGMGPFI